MCIYSCDLGGTFTKWGIYQNNQLVCHGEFESGASLGGKELLQRLTKHILLIKNDYDIKGIAVSSAGVINHQTGEVIQASNTIPGYRGMNIIETLHKVMNVPIVVENDVNCAMYAEAINGEGKHCDIVFGLTLGTGVGSAIIINKKIYHGASHFAGEVGYLEIGNESLDLSGSTRGLAMRVAKKKNEDLALWDGKRVFEGYFQQDQDCIEEIEAMASNIGEVISEAICFLNPDIIILGGAVLAQKEVLIPKIKACVKEKIPLTIYQETKIEAAVYGNLAGIQGAYLLFKEKHPEICF